MNIKENKGFTLLEMLLVIAIIAILAGIVIVAINPARQIAQANNAQRQSDVLAILNAVHQYNIDARGDLTDLNIPQVANAQTECLAATDLDSFICVGDTTDADCTNIEVFQNVVEAVTYIPAIPVDPTEAVGEYSGYIIVQDSNPSNGRITVCAPGAQNNETISVTR